jgi:hypothetical protein
MVGWYGIYYPMVWGMVGGGKDMEGGERWGVFDRVWYDYGMDWVSLPYTPPPHTAALCVCMFV